MPCEVITADELEQEILACTPEVCSEFYQFVLALQKDPLPVTRQHFAKHPNAFWQQLPSGYYIVWEVSGDIFRIATRGDTKGCTLRIAGFSRKKPASRSPSRR